MNVHAGKKDELAMCIVYQILLHCKYTLYMQAYELLISLSLYFNPQYSGALTHTSWPTPSSALWLWH